MSPRPWKIWRQGAATPLPEVTAPAPEALIASAHQMWRDACELAGARVLQERKALAGAVVDVQAQIEEVTEVAALYESQRDALTLQLAHVTSELNAGQERLQALEAQVVSLERLCGERMEAIGARGTARKAAQSDPIKS